MISATADFLSAKNDYPYTLAGENSKESYRRENSQMNAGKAELGCSWRPTSSSSSRQKSTIMERTAIFPGRPCITNPDNNERLRDENTFAQASCRTRLSSVLSLQGNAEINWSRSHYTDRDEVHPGGLPRPAFISSVNIMRPQRFALCACAGSAARLLGGLGSQQSEFHTA